MPAPFDMMNGGAMPPVDPTGVPGQPDQGAGTPPPATPDQGAGGEGEPTPAPAAEPATPAEPAAPAGGSPDKYKEVISQYGENAVANMVNEFEQVNQALQDPKQLEGLSKDEIVKLYNKRDELSKTLGELLPIIQENNRNKMDSHVNEMEHEGVKEYLNGLKEYLDDPEEMQTVVQVVKDVLAIVNGKKEAGGEPGKVTPADIKKVMGSDGGQPSNPNDIDINQALLSPDPAVRKQAMDILDGEIANVQKTGR